MKIGNSIVRLKTVDSTNQYLSELLTKNNKPAEGDLILAESQTKGQGMGDNQWESEKDKNLIFSVYLEPAFLKADKQFLLNKAVSLAVFDFIRGQLPNESIAIKWPNDIYINEDKVAGILINHAIQGNHILHSVIGIGININQRVFYSDAPNPVSLIHYLNKDLDLDDCLDEVCRYLNARYGQLKNNLSSKLNEDYKKILYRYNEMTQFKIPELGIYLSGKIIGVNEYGQLIISDETGTRREFGFKEVEFII